VIPKPRRKQTTLAEMAVIAGVSERTLRKIVSELFEMLEDPR
jgi:hypothetical protein